MNKKNKIIEAKDAEVVVHFPHRLEIRVVQANELKHYQYFQWLTTLLASITAGFWTAFFTSESNMAVLWAAGSFTVVTVVVGLLAFKYGRSVVVADGIKKSIDLSELK